MSPPIFARMPAPVRAAAAAAPIGVLLMLAAPGAGAEEEAFAGRYDVKGTTVDITSGDTRRIEGTMVLTLKDGVYSTHADLSTNFPTQGGAIRADVIGSGEGRVEGAVLSGTAETQLVMQTVPGVDTAFAFIPRRVGPRIVSTWSARWVNDVLVVELSNQPAEGETYSPTRTTLRGTRVTAPESSADE